MNVVAPVSNPLRDFAQAHSRLARSLPGGLAWQARRAQALERFAQLGLPTARDEGWKYTPVRLLEKWLLRSDGPETAAVATDAVQSHRLALEGVPTLVFHNGRLMPSLSDALPIEAAVRCRPLAECLEQAPTSMLERIEVPGDGGDERLPLLNLAMLADGLHVSAEANASATTLQLLFLYSGASGSVHPRIVVDVGANAGLQLIEHHVALEPVESASNCVTDIRLAAHARLKHILLVEGGARGIVLNTLLTRQAEGSQLGTHRVLLSGLLSRASLCAALSGERSEIEANSLLLADGREHLEIHSVIGHRAAATHSVERFRGIADASARGVFNGRIVVHPGAPKSESQQSSRTLLLSEQAEIDARPQLEILTDDVKCSHGATTGQLDENVLFYLLSRGLDPQTARALLIHAFLGDVLARVGLEPLRRHLEQRIARALPQAPLGELA
ncbi:MAG TPA: Fe-S cluster assembly protein SufD [Steroidobacteraceae bacterium]|nr:Fe-S cluster assembly protein SufD [Steroidobacteraceae bacterium]